MTTEKTIDSLEIKSCVEEDKKQEVVEVKHINSYSRWAGTGYKNDVYHVTCADGTAYEVNQKHDLFPGNNGMSYLSFSLSYKPLSVVEEAHKSFGHIAASMSAMVNMPWAVVVALNAPQANYDDIEKLKGVAVLRGTATKEQCNELSCGIGRRKLAILEILGEDLYNYYAVDLMSQQRSTKVADFLKK